MGISNLVGVKGNLLSFPSNHPPFPEVTTLVNSQVTVTESINLGVGLIWIQMVISSFITIATLNNFLSPHFLIKWRESQFLCVILEIWVKHMPGQMLFIILNTPPPQHPLSDRVTRQHCVFSFGNTFQIVLLFFQQIAVIKTISSYLEMTWFPVCSPCL